MANKTNNGQNVMLKNEVLALMPEVLNNIRV